MIVVLAIVLVAAYAAVCYFTGENLVATWWDEWRLARESLQDCDAFCSANETTSGIVVTLSTIPSRIGAIEPALKSLLRQTARPTEIRLCLPEWSRREDGPYVVPDCLRKLRNVTIVACADEGPATKFLSTLNSVAADQTVVVVDDDRIYHRRLLETFASLARAHPDEIISGAGWSVPLDLIDRPTTLTSRLARAPYVPVRANRIWKARAVDIVQGVHGYVVRPSFFDLGALGALAAAPESVRFVDDVWISAHARVPCRVYPLRIGYTDFKPWANRALINASSLGAKVNRTKRDEDRGNSIALRFFAERWRSAATLMAAEADRFDRDGPTQ